MPPQVAVFLATFVLLELMFLCAVLAGRLQAGRWHKVAFGSGLIGLVAVPMSLIGAIALFLQLASMTLVSAAGIAFVASGVTVISSFLVSAIALIGMRRGDRRAAG